MNILHVIPGLTWERGGPSTVVQALTRCQAQAGHRVSLLTTEQGARYGEAPVEVGDGVDVERLAVRGPDRVAYAPNFTCALRTRLRSCDVVHAHSIFTYPVHAALREASAAGVPLVLRPCGLLHRYSLRRSQWRKAVYLSLWGRTVRRACASWHFTSMNESQESWPWDDSPRFILPNGIDPAEYAVDRNKAREQVWQSLPELQKSEYVLFLGRLHPKKRLDVLLEAFLLGAPPEFKLVVAGPDESDLWRALAVRWLQARDVASRVVRVGTVTGRQKVMLFAGARLFALPSEHENFGIAPLEALAAGTPVLLSPQVDLSETVVAAGFGLTAPLTTAAWRERLTNILTDPAWLSAVADKARRWTAEHYSWDRLATQVVEHYHSIRQVGQWSQLAARTASASVSCPR